MASMDKNVKQALIEEKRKEAIERKRLFDEGLCPYCEQEISDWEKENFECCIDCHNDKGPLGYRPEPENFDIMDRENENDVP